MAIMMNSQGVMLAVAARGEAVVEMTLSTLLSFVMGFLLLVG